MIEFYGKSEEFFNILQSLEEQLTGGAGLKLDDRCAGTLADLSRRSHPRLVSFVLLQSGCLVMQILRWQNAFGDLHLLALFQHADIDGVLNEQPVRPSRR